MRLAVIPGDGIGVDVTAEAVKVVRAVGEVFGNEFCGGPVNPDIQKAEVTNDDPGQ